MDLAGFIRDDYCAKINSFKLWDLNIDKAPSATLNLIKLAPEDRHITVTEPSQYLQTASLLTFIFSTKDPAAPANILCMCQWERTSDTSITFRSPKMWSRWSPHQFSLCISKSFGSSASSFGCLSQVLGLSTTLWHCHVDIVRDQPPPSTTTTLEPPKAAFHTSLYPTPTWI